MSDSSELTIRMSIDDFSEDGDVMKSTVDMSLHGRLDKVVNLLGGNFGFNPFGHLIDELKHELEDLGNDLKKGLEDEANTLKSGLESTAKTLEGDLQSEYNKLSSDLESGVKTVLEAILAEIEKGALTKAVNLIKLLAPDSGSFGVGPLSFEVDNIHDRISDLEHYADNPPTSQDEVLDFVKTLAPDSVTVQVGIQVSEIFVTSSDESLQFSGTWTLDDFLKIADDIFKIIA